MTNPIDWDQKRKVYETEDGDIIVRVNVGASAAYMLLEDYQEGGSVELVSARFFDGVKPLGTFSNAEIERARFGEVRQASSGAMPVNKRACLLKWQQIINRMTAENGTVELGTLDAFYQEMKTLDGRNEH